MAKDQNGKELPKGITWREDKQLYMARFTHQGKSYTLYDKDLKAVKKKLADKRYEAEHGLQGTAGKISLDTWYKTWLNEYKIPVIKETSVYTYTKLYEGIIKNSLGKKYLSQIKPIHIQTLYNDLLDEGLSANYISCVNSVLYNILELACKNDLIVKNPCTGVTVPKAGKRDRRVLSADEQFLLLSYFKKDQWKAYEPLIVTLLGTGMRIGEALGLTWSDLDFTNRTVSVNKTLVYVKDIHTSHFAFKYQTPKTSSGIRIIPMQSDVADALRRQQIYQKRMRLYIGSGWNCLEGFEDLVFTGITGKPKSADGIRNVLINVVGEINADRQMLAEKDHTRATVMEHIHPHAFRHTFATRCFELDIPPKTVQQILGHSSLQMTMDLYTHVSEDKKRKDMEKLESLFKIS